MSQPPPMPVMPLSYDRVLPMNAPRPGAITAIGVIGIVMAVVGLGIALGTALFSLATSVAAQSQARALAMTNQNYPLENSASESPDGLTFAQAQAVVNGLQKARPMSPKQAAQMQSLAENFGKKLFSFGPESITIARVRSNVSESGEMLNSSGKLENYYVIGQGRIDVGESRAIFRDSDGDVYRSNEAAINNALDEGNINVFVRSVNDDLQTPLNAVQESSLRKMLRDPGQKIADPTNADFVTAGNMPDGGIWIHTGRAQIRMSADASPKLMSPSAPIPGTNPFSGKKITVGWAKALIGQAVVGAGLAVLLLIASIMLLRGRPRGRKLMIIYGAIALPLAVIGAIVVGFATAEWINAFATATNPVSMLHAYATSTVYGLFNIIWPVIVLIAMTRESVKEYFRGVI